MAFDVNSMSSNTSFDAALNRMANRVAGFEEEQAQLAESHTTGAANAAVAGGMLAKLDWGNPLALMQELEKQYSQLAQLANSAKRFQDNILSWADKVPMPQFSMGDAGTAQAPMAPVANAGPQIKAHTKISDKPDAPKPGADAPKPEGAGEGKEADAVKKEPLAEKDIEELKKTLADSKYDPSTQEFLLGKIKDKFKDDKVKAKEVAQLLPSNTADADSANWGNAFGVWLGENFHDLSEDQAKFATARLAFTEDQKADFIALKSPTVEFDNDEKAKYVYEVSGHQGTKGNAFADGTKVFKRDDRWFKEADGKETEIKNVEESEHGLLYFAKGNPIPNFLAPKAYFEGFESEGGQAVLSIAKARKNPDDLLGEKWVEEARLLTDAPSIKDKLKFEYTKADGEKLAKLDIHFQKNDKAAVLNWLEDDLNFDSENGGSKTNFSLVSGNFNNKNVEMWLNGKRKVDGFTTNATKALRDLVKDEEGEDAAAAPVPTPAASMSVAEDSTDLNAEFEDLKARWEGVKSDPKSVDFAPTLVDVNRYAQDGRLPDYFSTIPGAQAWLNAAKVEGDKIAGLDHETEGRVMAEEPAAPVAAQVDDGMVFDVAETGAYTAEELAEIAQEKLKQEFADLKLEFDVAYGMYGGLLGDVEDARKSKADFDRKNSSGLNTTIMQITSNATAEKFKSIPEFQKFKDEASKKTSELLDRRAKLPEPTPPSASLDTPTEFTVGALSPEDLAKKLHGSFS